MNRVSLLLLAVMLMGAAPGPTDWGGGYYTGPDSILSTPSTSGNGEGPLKTPAVQEAQTRCVGLASYATAAAKVNALHARFANIPDAPTAVIKAIVQPAERDLPETCVVSGIVAPDINFEIYMPTTSWNGKFMHYGCGGACGVIYRPQLEEPLARGYAVVASDMGHSAAPNVEAYRFANLQGVIDFSFRATHVVTLAAKDIIDAYYSRPPTLSYFMGCSTGGVQGMIEAQRYPYDFDGIIAGAPAYESGPSFLLWSARSNLDAHGNPILSASKLPMIRKAVLAACDGLDGIKDGLIQNPLMCKWDPKEIECKSGARGANCLSAAEVDVVRKLYSGPTDAQGHSLSYGPAGLSRGSEYGWSPSFITTKDFPSWWNPDPSTSMGDGVYPLAAANAGKPYDFNIDPKRGNMFWGGSVLEWFRFAGNPDLRRFHDNGGKLLVYHGWDDNEVSPGASVDYYELATRTMGGEEATKQFFRLFMIPGMSHCRRGPGGDAFDTISALENWREKGKAPDELIVHHLIKEQNYLGLPRPLYPLAAGTYDRTRPVYAFPGYAMYSGKGDPNDATSWMKAPRT